MLPYDIDFVPGTVLKYVERRGIPFEIRGELIPQRQVQHQITKVLAQLYDKTEIDDADKKRVANLGYGLSNRRYNKAAWGQLYQDEMEAFNYSHGRIRAELAPELWLVVERVQRELSEGYRPVGALILNGIRILLHQIVAAPGDSAVGVRTDCVC